MHKLGAKGVGKSFYVYKYNGIDIALPRTESKVSQGHRGFSVALANGIKQACKRRDFTINALMYDMQTESIVDLFGGIDDIKNKTLRIVDTQSFCEDSLRVLRAMQFCARFKLKIEHKSLDLMQGIDLADLSDQRVFKEFDKMFQAPHLHYGLYAMLQTKISQKIFYKELTFAKFLYYCKVLQQNFTAICLSTICEEILTLPA